MLTERKFIGEKAKRVQGSFALEKSGDQHDGQNVERGRNQTLNRAVQETGHGWYRHDKHRGTKTVDE